MFFGFCCRETGYPGGVSPLPSYANSAAHSEAFKERLCLWLSCLPACFPVCLLAWLLVCFLVRLLIVFVVFCLLMLCVNL